MTITERSLHQESNIYYQKIACEYIIAATDHQKDTSSKKMNFDFVFAFFIARCA
jgi:hypothetical protein